MRKLKSLVLEISFYKWLAGHELLKIIHVNMTFLKLQNISTSVETRVDLQLETRAREKHTKVKKKKKFCQKLSAKIVDISAPEGCRAILSSILNALQWSTYFQLPPYQISAWSDNVYHITAWLIDGEKEWLQQDQLLKH